MFFLHFVISGKFFENITDFSSILLTFSLCILKFWFNVSYFSYFLVICPVFAICEKFCEHFISCSLIFREWIVFLKCSINFGYYLNVFSTFRNLWEIFRKYYLRFDTSRNFFAICFGILLCCYLFFVFLVIFLIFTVCGKFYNVLVKF